MASGEVICVEQDNVFEVVKELLSKVDVKAMFEKDNKGEVIDDGLIGDYIDLLIGNMPIIVKVYQEEESFMDCGYGDKFEQTTEDREYVYGIYEFLHEIDLGDTLEQVSKFIKQKIGA